MTRRLTTPYDALAMDDTELTKAAVAALLPERPAEGHKGDFGHLFVLAGSRGFTGAAKLTCMAAARSGVGLVTLGIPFPLGDIMAVAFTETMGLRLPSTEAESFAHDALEPALKFAEDKQAVVLGPGLSRHPETVQFVLDFAPQCPAPLLVDADGLNALCEGPEVLYERRNDCVLTPHPGEMARLLACTARDVQADRAGAAQRLAEKTKAVVVLKGHRTVIADAQGRRAVNPTGNDGMATGGTGDVLSGLIGGLLAQGVPAFDAACLGVYLHGLAGDLAAAQTTPRALIASDIVAALPEAWRSLA